MINRQTIECCLFLLDTLHPDISVDYHFQDFIKHNKQILNHEVIYELFMGCYENRKVLNCIINDFYSRDGTNVLKSEENQYKLITYFVLFRLDQPPNGLQDFKDMIKFFEIHRTYKFLKFLINEKNLHSFLKESLLKILDPPYVDSRIVGPLAERLPVLSTIVKKLYNAVNNVKIPKASAPTTRTQPFELSEPRPRTVFIPKHIIHEVHAKKVPKSVYEQPKEREELKKIQLENKQKAFQLLEQAKINQPKCVNVPPRLKPEIQNEQKIFKANPPNLPPTNSIPVKLNTAAILKEGHLFKKKTEEVFKKIKDLENGNGNAYEFIKWQEETNAKEQEKLDMDLEKRILMSKLSYEEAILARERVAQERKKRAEMLKNEKEKLSEISQARQQEDQQKTKEIIEKVNRDKDNCREIQAKLVEEKKEIVKAVTEETKQLQKIAIEKAQEEIQKRMELIQQIKAMESIVNIKPLFVDLTNTAGHGLLSEMSIAELKERLQILQNEREREMQEKHDKIIKAKINKDKKIMDTLEYINKYKNESSKTDKEKEQKIQKKEVSVDKDPELQKLNEIIQNRKLERQKSKVESAKKNILQEKHNTHAQHAYLKQRKLLEANRMADLEHAQERTNKQQLSVN